MQPINPQIDPSWRAVLYDEFQQPYFAQLKQFLNDEKKAGKTIFPPGPLLFNAFNLTPFEAVRVVILGQDPYHAPGQAMGLSFSVPRGIAIPASLRNIYRELESDLQIAPAKHGDLTAWAQQGVLLLNTILTVEARQAMSHAKSGWQQFSDAVIRVLSEQRSGLVFMLWGRPARAKAALIDSSKHHILEAAHPSPLAGNAFQGCRHFSQANAILVRQGLLPIDWSL
ncbi:MAG: uracil-DNA glycosylase [Chitinophagales bacterium]|nr:uracil-DNA glycosylase [Chitinophagales bacterium]